MLPVCLLLAATAPLLVGAGAERPCADELLRTKAIALLRDSRRKDGPSHEQVVESLARGGPEVIDPLLDLLRDRRLPPTSEGERPQTLSLPQREMILGALARWSPRVVLANMELRVAVEPTEANRVAALYVYSSHGVARNFPRLLELAGGPPNPETEAVTLTAEEADALRSATTRILTRHPGGFRELAPALERASADELRPLLFAIGDTGDPCAVAVLGPLLARHPELAPITISQARRVGASSDAHANRALADAVRPYLASERTELASAAARALGELGDASAAPDLVAMLSTGDPALAESSHWALRRLSRLDFGLRLEAWSAWLASEREWWDLEAPQRLEELVRGSRATRLAAVATVGARTWQRHEATESVLAVLWDNDPLLRESACHALGQLASPTALPRLVEALADPELRVSAAARGALVSIVGTSLPEAPDECRKLLHLEN